MALLINISKNRKADINSGIVQPSMYRYIVHSVNYDQAHLISKALDIMFPHIVAWRVLRFMTKRGKMYSRSSVVQVDYDLAQLYR